MPAAVWPGQGHFRLVAGTGFEPARGFDAGTSPVVQTAAALGPGLLGWIGLDRAARDLAAPAAFRRHPCRGRVRPPLRRGSERDRSPRSPRRADRRGGRLATIRRHRRPAGLPARHLGADRAGADRGDRRLDQVHRVLDRRLCRIGAVCEYSSGASRVQGSITKAGNGHMRRLLVANVAIARELSGWCWSPATLN